MAGAELCHPVAVDTAERLGRMPPPVETFGWVTWAEEAASDLCHRLGVRADAHARHQRANPCGSCRHTMRRWLRAHS